MAARTDLRLAQLVCSRLCHDLAGISGAIVNGIELATEGSPGADAEALALVGQSARRVSARIEFFRAAFGANAPAQALADVAVLAEGYLAGSPVGLKPIAGPSATARLAPDGVRLALVLMMVAAGCLPRGGTIRIHAAELADGIGISLTASGKGATVRPEIAAALGGRPEPGSSSPREIHALWAGYLAGALDGRVEQIAEDGKVRLGAILPRDKSHGQ
jgi:histidine phosphotransferase ChpT